MSECHCHWVKTSRWQVSDTVASPSRIYEHLRLETGFSRGLLGAMNDLVWEQLEPRRLQVDGLRLAEHSVCCGLNEMKNAEARERNLARSLWKAVFQGRVYAGI